MLAEMRGRPDDASIRRALVRWGFNTKQRSSPPDDVAEVLDWVARNTAPVSALAATRDGPQDARPRHRHRWTAGTRPRGTRRQAPHRSWPTPWTARSSAACWKRTRSGCSSGRRPRYPARWTGAASSTPTRRGRCSMPYAPSSPAGHGCVAFFAVMYYAGLRPEEAINLERRQHRSCRLATWDAECQLWQDPPRMADWGELHSAQRNARCGQRMDRRRQPAGAEAAEAPGRGDTRIVPDPSRTDQAAPRSPRELRHGPTTAASSPVCGAANCPRSPTGAPGSKRARRRSPRPSKPRR